MIEHNNPTRAEISLDALEHNYHSIRSRLSPGCRVMAMIKADAYGHGAIPVARLLERAGVDYLEVANIYEAVGLRDAGITAPILVAGYTEARLAVELIRHNLTQEAQDLRIAREYAAHVRNGDRLRVHIKLDTGMSRCGIACLGREEEAAREAAEICRMPELKVEGLFTHFADSDNPDSAFMESQATSFTKCLDFLGNQGIKIPIRHCANSAAMIKCSCFHLDMVRTGLALYGLVPPDVDVPERDFIPVMTLKSVIGQVKDIPLGATVSYGRRFTAQRPTRIAVVPIGYGDGYCRYNTSASMTVRGMRAPVAGAVCMDLCMLDITDIPGAREGDEVVVMGPPPHPTADELAKNGNTINYEVITGISKRVLRVYLRNGEVVEKLFYI